MAVATEETDATVLLDDGLPTPGNAVSGVFGSIGGLAWNGECLSLLAWLIIGFPGVCIEVDLLDTPERRMLYRCCPVSPWGHESFSL
ncbi:MAG: hypothetical protein R3C59_02785 [Planctomycetaceae bacterium]